VAEGLNGRLVLGRQILPALPLQLDSIWSLSGFASKLTSLKSLGAQSGLPATGSDARSDRIGQTTFRNSFTGEQMNFTLD
jgi:hypothetical protein